MDLEPLARFALVYSAQALVVIGVAALAEIVGRLADPRVRLIYWRSVGVACLALPAIASARPAAPSAAITVVAGSIGSVQIAPSDPWWPAWSLVATGILFIGMLARSGWLLLGALRLRLIRGRSTPADVGADIDALHTLLAPNAEFRWSDEVGQPVTFGARRPVILLPPSCLVMSEDEQRAVACHELLHVARRDWLWIVFEEHVRSLFWFHPGVWWLLERIQVSREQLIDQLVVRQLGSRRAYMSALIAFAGGAVYSPSTAFLRRRHLRSRLRLLSQESSMSPTRLVSVAAALVLVVSGTTVGVARALPLEMPVSIAQAKPSLRLEIRLAEDTPGAGLTEAVVSESQRRIYLHPTALVTNADVASARVVSENRGGLLSHSVAVTFTSAAADRVTAATGAHLGKPLAILIDGRIVAVPVVRDAIGASAVINGNFTAEQANVLANGLASSDGGATLVKGPGAGIIMPVPLTRVQPEYTADAMARRIQGVVVMTAVVRADGTVDDITVTRSLYRELDDQAVAALRQWTFRPGTKNGEPVAVQVMIETEFTLRK